MNKINEPIEIRPLETEDLFTVVDMFKKVGNTKLNELITSDSSSTKESTSDANQSIQLGITVLTALYENVVGDLKAWFASLINKSVEEYMKTPATTTLDIIDYLTDAEDSQGFFSRALQLYRRISKLRNGSKSK